MKAILHADREWGIGKDNSLMFSIPEDMKFFRQTTSGNAVVMGGNTLRSFPGGRPLKNRVNIVLSRTLGKRDDCIVVDTFEKLAGEILRYDTDRVYVIGGACIYDMLLPYCDEVLVTKVDAVGGADTFFRNLDEDGDFSLVSRSDAVESNGYTLHFCTYRNNNVRPLAVGCCKSRPD